jgi:hypothetical protein
LGITELQLIRPAERVSETMASFVGLLMFVLLVLSPVLIPLVITGFHAVAGHGNRKPPPRSITRRSSAAVKVTGES